MNYHNFHQQICTTPYPLPRFVRQTIFALALLFSLFLIAGCSNQNPQSTPGGDFDASIGNSPETQTELVSNTVTPKPSDVVYMPASSLCPTPPPSPSPSPTPSPSPLPTPYITSNADLESPLLNEAVQIAAGQDFTLALMKDGSLYGWGSNFYGQLGLGRIHIRRSPTLLLRGVKSITANRNIAYAIMEDDSLWGWGGKYSIIGDTPKYFMDNVAMVSIGEDHTLAVKKDGTLLGWGYNRKYQLGWVYQPDLGDTELGWLPIQHFSHDEPALIMDHVRYAAAGPHCSYIINTDDELFALGLNCDPNSDTDCEIYNVPLLIARDVRTVTAESDTCFYINNDGELWIWGKSIFNNATKASYERDSSNETITNERFRKLMDDVIEVSCQYDHTLILKADGTLWGLGTCKLGKLGLGKTNLAYAQQPIKISDSMISARTGWGHSVFLRSDGSVWVSGVNWDGQIGDASYAPYRTEFICVVSKD